MKCDCLPEQEPQGYGSKKNYVMLVWISKAHTIVFFFISCHFNLHIQRSTTVEKTPKFEFTIRKEARLLMSIFRTSTLQWHRFGIKQDSILF